MSFQKTYLTEDEILLWFSKLPNYDKYVEAIGEYNKELSYAGPADNNILMILIPETAWGIDLGLCFYQHDAGHEMGGDENDRWLSDTAMLSTGLFIIEKTPNRWYLFGVNGIRRHLARIRLIKYFEIVRSLGYQYFHYRME